MKRKIDWQRKLTSRKLWTSVASFATLLIVALTGDKDTAVEVAGLIMAGATVIGYVVGEGLADGARVEYVTEEDFYQNENYYKE